MDDLGCRMRREKEDYMTPLNLTLWNSLITKLPMFSLGTSNRGGIRGYIYNPRSKLPRAKSIAWLEPEVVGRAYRYNSQEGVHNVKDSVFAFSFFFFWAG